MKKIKEITIVCDQEVKSIKDVLTDEQYQKIMEAYASGTFNPHECHRNAFMVSLILECEYCEGFLGITEHAFNKVNGQYIDVTSELVNGCLEPVKVKRVYTLSQIRKIVNREHATLITFRGHLNYNWQWVYYDDNGKRVVNPPVHPSMMEGYYR